MLSGLEFQYLLCVNVDTTVKLLNTSFYIVQNIDSARSQLIEIVDPLWHNVKANGFVFDKLHLVVAPQSDHTVTRKDDLLVKSALFNLLISTNRQL